MNYWNKKHDTSEYRSGLEDIISDQLKALKIPVLYEKHLIRYTIPEAQHRYTPDFVLPNGIIIETKGRFTPKDRQKMALVITQHPELDIRMVFSNSKTKLSKASKTTYGMWCDKHGILYANKSIPLEWINETTDPLKLTSINALLKKKV